MRQIYQNSVIFSIALCLFMACQPATIKKISWIEKKADSLVSIMTLNEKIGQMTQVRHFSDIKKGDVKSKFIGSVIHTDGPMPGKNAFEWQQKFRELQEEALSTRLGIPLLLAVDAIHGQNTFPGATIFPHNIGLAASKNIELVKEIAQITAIETQATGFNWTFSPCASVPLNERWGRVYEAFSEDTELTKQMVEASVLGLQGKLNAANTVLATAKHFIGDGATEYGIEGGNTSLSAAEIYKFLLPPFQAAIHNNVGAIMASFNTYNQEPMHSYKTFLTDSLKKGLGFKGILITDWKGYSKFGGNAIINAGIDMVMAVDGDLPLFQEGLKEGVENGEVPIERINDAVKRILIQKIKLGLFKNPFPEKKLINKIGCAEHREVAQKAVRESLVLLKNENESLPIAKSAKKIVIIGKHANNTGLQSGGWTISWQGKAKNYEGATSILAGFKELSNAEIIFDSLGTLQQYDADYAIVFVGEKPYAEFFGDVIDENSPFQLTLDENHKQYIENYYNKGPKLIVVLISGRPLLVTNEINLSDAFVAAWLPGSEGKGIAEVLLGHYNFTGSLPHSWPKNAANFSGKYGPNFWDKSNIPLYQLGYGLRFNLTGH